MRKHPLDFPGSQAAMFDRGPFDEVVLVEVVDTRDDGVFGGNALIREVSVYVLYWVDSRNLTPLGPVARALLRVKP